MNNKCDKNTNKLDNDLKQALKTKLNDLNQKIKKEKKKDINNNNLILSPKEFNGNGINYFINSPRNINSIGNINSPKDINSKKNSND